MAFKLSFPVPTSRWACIAKLDTKDNLGIVVHGLTLRVFPHSVDTAQGRSVVGFHACVVMATGDEAYELEAKLKADGFDTYIQPVKG